MTITDYIRQNPFEGGNRTHYANALSKAYKLATGQKASAEYIRKKSKKLFPVGSEVMKVTRENLDKNGEVTSTTRSLRKIDVDPEDLGDIQIISGTTNPNGSQWVRWKVKELETKSAIDAIKKVLTGEIEAYTPPKVKGKGATMVVYSSDKHFGAHTKENSVYENEYSPKIFRQRHDKLIDRIYKETKRFGKLDELVYFDLGDAADGLDGHTTRGGHKLPQNLDNKGQWREYVHEHKRAFDKIVDMNPAAKYRFIGASNSNHGGDFDLILMETLELYLNLKYPFIKTHVSDKPFDHCEIAGHSFIYGHGKDDEDMRSGFPLNLNDKTENWINDYIDQKGLKGKIHFVAGDLHQSAHNYGKRFRYRRVLSLYGSSKWIHTNFGQSRAGVSYDIIDADQVYYLDLML